MEYGIESTPQDFEPTECANWTVFVWELALDGSYGKWNLHTTLMSDKGHVLRHTQSNIERKEALRCAHVCVRNPLAYVVHDVYAPTCGLFFGLRSSCYI